MGVVLAVLVVLLASAVGFAYSYRAARAVEATITAEVKAGQSEIVTGEALLKSAKTKHALGEIGQAKTHFAAAHQLFAKARSLATGDARVQFAISQLPTPFHGYVTDREAVVANVTLMGDALADAGNDAADMDSLLIQPPSNKSASGGQKLLAILNQAPPIIDRLGQDLNLAKIHANQVNIALLPATQRATIAKAKDTIGKGVSGIAEFKRMLPVLTELLGGNGPRLYIVEQVNPAELRSGGGFIGTESLLKADAGDLKVVQSGNSGTLAPKIYSGEPGYVAPPNWLPTGPSRGTWANSWSTGYGWTFLDSNLFPTFAANAKWAASFLNRQLGVKVDGVIALDYYTVASMLNFTGPISLTDYGITFTATNFVRTAFDLDVSNSEHKSILTQAVQPLIKGVAALPPDRWTDLVKVMNDDVTHRHMQVYFTNPAVQAEMTRVGWLRGLNPTGAADFMYESEDNLGFTKANYFTTRRYDITLSRIAAGLHHKVVVNLTDNPPSWYGNPARYYFYSRIYTPADASNLRINGDPTVYPVNPTGADDVPSGAKAVGAWAYIDAWAGYSNTQKLVFEYDTPWQTGSGTNSIYWQKQPGTLDDAVSLTWVVNGHGYRTTGKLDQDELITLSDSGVSLKPGRPAEAALPGLGFSSS